MKIAEDTYDQPLAISNSYKSETDLNYFYYDWIYEGVFLDELEIICFYYFYFTTFSEEILLKYDEKTFSEEIIEKFNEFEKYENFDFANNQIDVFLKIINKDETYKIDNEVIEFKNSKDLKFFTNTLIEVKKNLPNYE